jgi:signal transduction histidine kinase
MLKELTNSLSARLLLLFIFSGALLLLLVGVVVGKGYSSHLRSSVWPFMVHYVSLMEHQLGTPPQYDRAVEITRDTPVAIHVYGPSESWSTGSRLPDRKSLVPTSTATDRAFGPYQRYRIRSLDETLVLHSSVGGYEVFYQVSPPRGGYPDSPYNRIILWSIVGILVLIYLATKMLFRPIEDIQEGVALIGSGHLDYRISRRRNDEFGELADNVNAMADEINKMLEAKRQLLLGISHELRSPLTRSRVHLALMEDSSSKQEVEREIIAMEQMITELLESERLNARHVSLNRDKVRLDELVRDMVAHEFPRRVEVMDLAPETGEFDVARMKLLLRNLLQNAVRHSVDPERKPTVSVVAEPGMLSLYVTDSGAGIDADQIPHLTEPFYRADPSRQRKTGGYGLGLYLCKVIVEAHDGRMEIESGMDTGTTIRCAFPH